MGGGDLNSKKSWHPNTMKNQERVWKAEQAAAEEKKRIMELQNERALERDKAELNEMAKRSAGNAMDDHRLHWMYNKPDKNVQQEDYLLGKTIDRHFDESEKGMQDSVIPAVARRVIGSSMLATSDDSQVDLARKIREDPLLLVKERERAARAALLNNPLQRRKLTELLRKEQEKSKEHKKPKKIEKELDSMLAAKLSALSSNKGLSLATLLASDDSSSESSDEKSKKKKHKKKKKKSKKSQTSEKKIKKKKKESDYESSEDEKSKKKNDKIDNDKYHEVRSRKRKSDNYDSDKEDRARKARKYADMRADVNRRQVRDRSNERSRDKSPYHKDKRDESRKQKRGAMSEEERAAKLAAMAAAGSEREQERARRVADQRIAAAVEDKMPRGSRVSNRNEARSLPDSLESRIHSNRHYIQRDRRHMNEHFARR